MVKHITYKEQKYPVRISYYALKMLKEKHGTSIIEMKDDDYSAYECLLFYSLKKGAELESIEMPFKEEEMEQVMDAVFFDFIKLIPEFFPAIEAQVKATKGGSKVLESKK